MRPFVPRVSLGIPVYNGEKYLALALDSLVQQDYKDFEIIISDNASTDGTSEIYRAYAARDSRVSYYRNEENVGSARNYERVFELSRGQFFKWCAHDDVCHPAFLSRCMAVMESAPSSVALVYPQCDLIGEAGELLGRAPDRLETQAKRPYQRLAHTLRNVGYAYSLWGIVRSDLLRKTRLGGRANYWDDVLLAELSLLGEFLEVPEVLFELRYHKGNALGVSSSAEGFVAWRDPLKASKKTRKALLAWTDPANSKRKIWLPVQEELYCEYLKGVHHARLPLFQKCLCYLTVPVVCYWRRFRNFGAIAKRKVIGAFFGQSESRKSPPRSG